VYYFGLLVPRRAADSNEEKKMSASYNKVSPSTIMRNVYAVYPSFAMLAGMQLGVFTPLKDGPMNVEDLAGALNVLPEKLAPLLYALVTANLLTVEDGVFSNTEESDMFLVADQPDYVGGLSDFYNNLWHAALNTAESIRTGRPQSKLEWMSLPEGQLLKYFSSQYPSSLRAGRQLARRKDFKNSKCLLDAGGGTGGLSIGICETFPHLRATVIDLPAVTPISTRFIRDAGMSGRIDIADADLVDSPPSGNYDVAVLRALIQVMPPEHARKVLRNISQVMEKGSPIYIVGCVLDDTRLSPPASIAFSLIFLNVYDDGRAYTEKEHRDLLLAAGFTDVHVEHNAMVDGLAIVSARKA
jgi:hypothetical protein